MNSIPKIVLSGGPCGGKTEGIEYLNKQLSLLGYNVIIIRESAKMLISSGVDRNNPFEFQKAIAINQMKLEAEAEVKAHNYDKPVILCDRGLMDAKVYLNNSEFDLLKEKNFQELYIHIF